MATEANSFSHIGAVCVRVLARQAAINAVRSELQRRGERVHSVHLPMIWLSGAAHFATLNAKGAPH